MRVYAEELVYWPLRFLNMSVLFLPPKGVVHIPGPAAGLFTLPKDSPTPWGVAFLRNVIWPRVKERYASYPTYRRLAFIKSVSGGGLTPWRGFRVTPHVRKVLREEGFFLVEEHIPVPERMWYINHAEHIFITWGSLAGTMLPLRVENPRNLTVKVLYHGLYGYEMGKTMMMRQMPKNPYQRAQRAGGTLPVRNGGGVYVRQGTFIIEYVRPLDRHSINTVPFHESQRVMAIRDNNLDVLLGSDYLRT
jgi:hypothetical protein